MKYNIRSVLLRITYDRYRIDVLPFAIVYSIIAYTLVVFFFVYACFLFIRLLLFSVNFRKIRAYNQKYLCILPHTHTHTHCQISLGTVAVMVVATAAAEVFESKWEKYRENCDILQ